MRALRFKLALAILLTLWFAFLCVSVDQFFAALALTMALLLLLPDLRPAQVRTDTSLFGMVFENSGNGILISDHKNRILAVNRAFTAITGYTQQDIVGKNPRVLSSGRHGKLFYTAMWEAITTKGMWQGEIWDRRKNGKIYAEWLTINTVKNSGGRITHHIAIFSDITEQRVAAAHVEYLATHDALTGLPNRALFSELLNNILAGAKRANEVVALFYLDIDRFKEVNDTLGHDIGDRLLVTVAERLLEIVRADDVVARRSGDEFTMACAHLRNRLDAAALADKILHLCNLPFSVDGQSLHISISLGIALFPEDGADIEILLRRADAALYRVKNTGRNNYAFWNEGASLP